FGGTVPALTWNRFMSAAMYGQPVIPFAQPGILPQPDSGLRKAEKQDFPAIVRDCGGPCIQMPTLTTPPTTAPPDTQPPPPPTAPDTSDSDSTTSSTAPRGIGKTP